MSIGTIISVGKTPYKLKICNNYSDNLDIFIRTSKNPDQIAKQFTVNNMTSK
jgi:hypothetical protein